jgi:DNA polymerase I
MQFITKNTYLDITGISIVDTLDHCISYCSSKTMLAIDTETTGLDFIDDKILLFQIGDSDAQFVIDCTTISLTPIIPILLDVNIQKVFHNVKFDYKFIRKALDIQIENVYDTMLAEAVIHCGKKNLSKSLSATAERHLGIQLSKAEQNSFIGLVGTVQFTLSQLEYAAKDIEILLDIKRSQEKAVCVNGLERVVKLENYASLAFADIEYNGIGIDKDTWLDTAESVLKELNVLEEELYHMILSDPMFTDFVPKNYTLSLFDTEEGSRITTLKNTFSFSSPKQVLNLFNKIDKDLDSVNGKLLATIKGKHEIIGKYITFKEKEKLYNAYGPSFLDKYLKSDGKIHTAFNQILDTGRVSSRDPNMQQIPADNKYRNAFVADDGYVFASSDFSSQELCIIATGSQDPVWIQALETGQDLHSVCAELVFDVRWSDAADSNCKFYSQNKAKCSCPKHGKLRTQVKSINFGLAYGMSAHKLSDTLQISLSEAEELIEKYFTAFPRIKNFLTKLGNYGTSNGHIRTFKPYRRIRWFPNWEPYMRDMVEFGSIERASKNTPIQGTGADMTKEALVIMRKFILKNKLPVKIVMTVHDQIDTIVHADYADQWKRDMKAIMERAALTTIPNGLLKSDTNLSLTWEK